MSRILLLVFTFVLSAAWLQAQSQYPSQTGSSQTGSSASAQTNVEGCLQSANGNYTLTDKSGTTYQLQGDTAKLADHVGHEVRITGTTSGAAGTSSSMAGQSGATQQPTLTVTKLKHISKNCQSASSK